MTARVNIHIATLPARCTVQYSFDTAAVWRSMVVAAGAHGIIQAVVAGVHETGLFNPMSCHAPAASTPAQAQERQLKAW